MAAPSGITWGEIVDVKDEGRIGIYTSLSSTNTQTTVSVQIWFGSKYSVSDSNNELFYNILSSSGSATTSKGSVSVKTTVSTGSGWSSSNEIKLASYTHTYSRGTSASTKYIYAKLTGIDVVGAQMLASKTVSIPALATYTVSYNANGGSGAPSSQTKTYGKTLTLSSTKPTRTGYSFQGWATSASGSVAYDSGDSYTTNAAATLYAVWKANTYTVSYNANGGSGAPSSQTKTHDKTLTLSSTKPTRTGYSFKNWNTKTDGTGTSYSASGSFTTNANTTLYAQWTANEYTITYNANGGTGAPGSQKKTHGVTLTLSTTKPTRTNYTFKGWATASNATTAQYSAGGSFTTNANTTLYAVWELAYKKPTISGLTVTRCDSNGTAGAGGTYLKVAFNWTTFSATPTIKIFWKSPSTSESSATADASGTSGSVSQIVGDNAISANSSYTVRVTVNDGTETATLSKTIVGALKPISVLAQGKGIAFGKSAELDDYMDVKYKTRFRSGIRIDDGMSIYCKPTDENEAEINVFTPRNTNGHTILGYGNYANAKGNTHVYGDNVNIMAAKGIGIGITSPTSGYLDVGINSIFQKQVVVANGVIVQGKKADGAWRNAFEPMNKNNTTVIGWGNYYYADCDTNIYGKDVVIGVANTATKGTFRPYFRTGDSFTVTINTAGYLTNSKKNLYFTIPLDRPYIGVNGVTVATTSSFTLRQNDNYTHGSSTSATAKASSIEAALQYGVGIRVNAAFTTTTNAINNDAIGIGFSGVVTFT